MPKQGCTSDCLGILTGWNCVGGNKTSRTICNEILDDGIIVGNELCDDGILVGSKLCGGQLENITWGSDWGCFPNSSGVNLGWNCTSHAIPSNPSLTYSICVEDCGDGLRVGCETCDDNNQHDGMGCTFDCT